HRAPAHRPHQLAREPEVLGLPPRGARVDGPPRRARLARRVARVQPRPRAVLVVEQPRAGARQGRGLADRLPARDTDGEGDARRVAKDALAADPPSWPRRILRWRDK